MNVLAGTLRVGAGGTEVEAAGTRAGRCPCRCTATAGQSVHYGIRPGDIHLAPAGSGIAAKVIVVEPTGAETELLLQVGDAQIISVIHGRTGAKPDDTIYLAIDADKAHVFDGRAGSAWLGDERLSKVGASRQAAFAGGSGEVHDGSGKAAGAGRAGAPVRRRGAQGSWPRARQRASFV
jgi:hypothetical protein